MDDQSHMDINYTKVKNGTSDLKPFQPMKLVRKTDGLGPLAKTSKENIEIMAPYLKSVFSKTGS